MQAETELMTETREQLESERARHAHEAGSARRALAYWYERNRLLENRVRAATEETGLKERSEALNALVRYIPAKPRKKWAIGRFTKQGRRH